MYRTFLMSERSSLNSGWFRISGFGAQQSLHVGCSQQRQARAKFKSRSNSTSLLWAHVSYSFSCSSVTNSLMCLTEHQLILWWGEASFSTFQLLSSNIQSISLSLALPSSPLRAWTKCRVSLWTKLKIWNWSSPLSPAWRKTREANGYKTCIERWWSRRC